MINIMGKPDAKEYIDRYFRQKLESEGFLCPDGKSLCWYRIRNDSIVHTIIFFFIFSRAPWSILMGHSFHPLFESPVYTKKAYFAERPFVPESLMEQFLFAAKPGSMPMLTNRPVIVPQDGENGIYRLDRVVLPDMEKATSIEACYQLHKMHRLEGIDGQAPLKFGAIASLFIDEAIYMNDEEVFPYCIERCDTGIEMAQKDCKAKPSSKQYAKDLEAWKWRKAALTEGRREEYLQILNDRLQTNIQEFRKFLGQKST